MQLVDLQFDNRFARSLPGDSGPEHQSRFVLGAAYSFVRPTPVAQPELLLWSNGAGTVLDLEPPALDSPTAKIYAQIFSGCRILPGMQPFAARYGGHQFGNWAGQLGDGRAISLGEVKNQKGESWEVQLKGSGPTPYSRRADGRAVLRSSVREFLCSESMFHLQVPTTRALACVLTGEEVIRDMFYDGNPKPEPGAIVTRLAPNFIRFGNFEILASENDLELLRRLLDFTISTQFPDLLAEPDTEKRYVTFLKVVATRTAHLMTEWLRVGFVHGVMNTDNMSILGLTIDYGPYGWIDVYDPEWTPNTTDFESRRYRFGQQPSVAYWNLSRLAMSLAPLFKDPEILIEGLDAFRTTFETEYPKMMGKKLGLSLSTSETDLQFLQSLEEALTSTETDMTIFYRRLGDIRALVPHNNLSRAHQLLNDAFYLQSPPAEALAKMDHWLSLYFLRAEQESNLKDSPEAPGKFKNSQIQSEMNSHNPYFVLRNYLVQEALDLFAQGDRSRLDALLKALQTPYEENETTRPFFSKRPEWARTKAGCSALSCSS